MATELYSNLPSTTVTSGGTTTSDTTWTVSSSASFPGASNSLTPPTQFHVSDAALNSEIIAVTNVSGTTWTVVRGAEGTNPVAHTTGFTIYQVTTAGGLGSFPQYYNVRAYGAKGDNSTDDTSAVAAAITAATNAGGGTVYVPAGTYKITGSGLTINQDINLVGEGSTVAELNYTGSATLLTVIVSGSFTGGQYAGKVQGLYLNGYSAGASAVGVQVEDLQGLDMSDMAIYGFGGKGIYYLHGTGYAEESTVRARIVQCGTYGSNTTGAVVFSSTSFDYGNYDFTIVTYPGTHGIVLRDGAQLRGANLRVRGNFYARTTANTGAVIAIDPDNNTGGISNTSYITDSNLDVAVEAAGTGGQIGHTFVLMGSSNSGSQFTAQGALSFNPNGNNTIYSQGFSNANSVPFGFSGYIQDGLQTGPPGNPGDCLQVKGGSNWYPNGTLSSSAGGTGVDFYWNFGDVAEGRLNNGNNSLVFHSTTGGNFVRRCDLWLAQPASGAAGTVTWPTGTKWPGGTPPTLSSTNGYVDHVRLTYLPDTAVWYGELIGTHYS